jgi:Na+-transporting methylmalonyl-CoA/oxaloacetate decarboxylase beta subunit
MLQHGFLAHGKRPMHAFADVAFLFATFKVYLFDNIYIYIYIYTHTHTHLLFIKLEACRVNIVGGADGKNAIRLKPRC